MRRNVVEMAWRSGVFSFTAKGQIIEGGSEAKKLLAREYRKPWKLDV